MRLSDFRKKKIVVLNFWTTWNPAAEDELMILDNYYQKIKNSPDFAVLAVNNQEDKKIVDNFLRRSGASLPVLYDERGEAGELYKLSILPTTYFINRRGAVADFYVGILSEAEIKDRAEKLLLE